jgi:predicted amidophosphoribosyltransferase
MRPISGGVCTICGERLFSSYAFAGAEDEAHCGLCRRIEPAFARAAAYGSYESGLRELIHLLKYGGVRPAANVLGRMLAEAIATLEPDFPADSIAVIPVPLHRTKLRQRGFNQAELIARAAMRVRGSGDRLQLCAGVLERKRDTASQIGLPSHQRRQNLRGAFRIAQPEAVAGREVLVWMMFTQLARPFQSAREFCAVQAQPRSGSRPSPAPSRFRPSMLRSGNDKGMTRRKQRPMFGRSR